MTINSDQVNYLVLRYLSESGFDHAAFTLKSEMRNAEGLDTAWATRVPTGHLVNSLQKALMFEECLAQVDEEGNMKEGEEVNASGLIPGTSNSLATEKVTNGIHSGKRKQEVNSKQPLAEKRAKTPPAEPKNKPAEVKDTRDAVMTDAPSTITPTKDADQALQEAYLLKGHTGGLDQCAWNPTKSNMLATSSTDGTARIWTLTSGPNSSTSIVLNCGSTRTKDKSVTCIAWNKTGSHLATGSYDGVTRIWTPAGVKSHRDLTFHNGPVLTLQWSRRSDFVLSGGGEGLVGLWSVHLGTLQQKWDLKAAVVDVEWISDALFLAACKDGTLRMIQLGRDPAVKQFAGHESALNVLKWNSNINLGATGADDGVVKVWRADSETPTQVLRQHRSPIHTLEWAPKDYGDYRILASASRDGRVCVWDVVRGELLHILNHDRPIFTIHFSPTNLLATGGASGETFVWNAETGKVVKTDRSREGHTLYNVKFNTTGTKVAVARSNEIALILDVPQN